MTKIGVLICIMVFIGSGCKELPENSPTYGSVKIVVDETLFPTVDALEAAFEHTYSDAVVQVDYLPEHEAFKQFYENDSVKLIIAARSLTEKEKSYFTTRKLNPRTSILANDAIALLVHPASGDTAITCEQVQQIIRGELVNWEQISPTATGPITTVFDNQASSTVSYLLDHFGASSLPQNAYALKSTQEVVEYVSKQRGAIGVVGYSWLSDYDDPQCRAFRSKVKVISLSPCGNNASKGYYQPFATNVLNELYPMSRQIFVINRETNSGLGTGFSAFVCGEVGQRIISKTGILPAYKVEHNIELKSERFDVEN